MNNYIVFFVVTTLLVINVPHVFCWKYDSHDQWQWHKDYPDCGHTQQSPIALTGSLYAAFSLLMPAMEFVGYKNPLPGPLTLTNKGHTVELTIPKYQSTVQDREDENFIRPYIFGGQLDDEYQLESLHFHWGDQNHLGSEHTINGLRPSMEMHIIHVNKKYQNMTEALKHIDGLCVLAVFYQAADYDAKLLTPIVQNLSLVTNHNDSMQLPYTFSMASILSGLDTERFYSYRGSLTTPPCSEAVTWVVFSDILTIPVYHMEKFRLLRSHLNKPLVNNFRNLQNLNDRSVLMRVPSSHPKFNDVTNIRGQWIDPNPEHINRDLYNY